MFKRIVLISLFVLPLYSQVCDVTGDGYLNVSDIVELVYIIIENPAPEASFIADPMYGEPPLNVSFTNTSYIGSGVSLLYEWDFDDGSPIASEENPNHTFIDVGVYNVCLTVTTDVGMDAFCDVIAASSGVAVDIDGNIYDTITIGNQEWMAENLKVTHYRNGDEIPNITNNSEWGSLSAGAYGVYDNDPANADTYGNLYNWYAVDDARGVCPEGWHVPTDEEWMELEMTLGMSYEEAHSYGYRGTDQGSQLAGNAGLWNNGGLENNGEFGTSGFMALPGGYRNSSYGTYYYMGIYDSFWSSTAYNSHDAWYRGLYYNHSEVRRQDSSKHYGFSVRCVRPVE